SVFRQAEIDFKDHFNISRYDLLPKKHADAALAYWMTWEPSTNTKMKIMELNAFSQA
ncbi:ORF6C domain-containing protein, partial [Streptococcus pneumoniae]